MVNKDKFVNGDEGTHDDQKVLTTYLNDDELEYFRQIILTKRSEALNEIEQMNTRLEDAQEQASGYTYHMADSGT